MRRRAEVEKFLLEDSKARRAMKDDMAAVGRCAYRELTGSRRRGVWSFDACFLGPPRELLKDQAREPRTSGHIQCTCVPD